MKNEKKTSESDSKPGSGVTGKQKSRENEVKKNTEKNGDNNPGKKKYMPNDKDTKTTDPDAG